MSDKEQYSFRNLKRHKVNCIPRNPYVPDYYQITTDTKETISNNTNPTEHNVTQDLSKEQLGEKRQSTLITIQIRNTLQYYKKDQ